MTQSESFKIGTKLISVLSIWPTPTKHPKAHLDQCRIAVGICAGPHRRHVPLAPGQASVDIPLSGACQSQFRIVKQIVRYHLHTSSPPLPLSWSYQFCPNTQHTSLAHKICMGASCVTPRHFPPIRHKTHSSSTTQALGWDAACPAGRRMPSETHKKAIKDLISVSTMSFQRSSISLTTSIPSIQIEGSPICPPYCYDCATSQWDCYLEDSIDQGVIKLLRMPSSNVFMDLRWTLSTSQHDQKHWNTKDLEGKSPWNE